MMCYYNNIIVLVFLGSFSCTTAATTAKDESGETADRECDLNSASKCLVSVQNILDCYLNPARNCSLLQSKVKLPSENLFLEICNSMTYTIDDCLMDLLGYGCNGTELHGFYQQWMAPIRAVIRKLCNDNESILRNLTDSMDSNCGRGSFTNCLWQTEKKMDLIDLFSTEMTPETCTELDARLQFCLQFDDSHCKSLVDIILVLGKEFVDNAACKNQPIIWVPLADDKKLKDNNETDDRDCSPRLALECFTPMVTKWISYLEHDKDDSSNFTEVCSFTDYAINTCGVEILGFGCENTPVHHYYLDWLPYLTGLFESVCGKIEEDVKGKSCWLNFISGIRTSDLAGNFLDIITSQISSTTCGLIADAVDSSLSRLTFPQCDQMLEIVDRQKNLLLKSQNCLNGEFRLQSEKNTSSSKAAQFSLTDLTSAYVFYYILWTQVNSIIH